jgi:hypothetical protein
MSAVKELLLNVLEESGGNALLHDWLRICGSILGVKVS